MFVLEFESAPPPQSATYYSLVVRKEPYLIGRLENCDIALPALKDVSRQHAKLEVMRTSEARTLDATQAPGKIASSPVRRLLHSEGVERQVKFSDDVDDVVSTSPSPRKREATSSSLDDVLLPMQTPGNPLEWYHTIEEDPLVLRVTNMSQFGVVLTRPSPSGGGAAESEEEEEEGCILLSSAFVHSGWRLRIGNQCTLLISFRVVVVSVARDYTPQYIDELEQVYYMLGASCTSESGPIPLPSSSSSAQSQSPPGKTAQSSTGSVVNRRRLLSLQAQRQPILLAHVCESISDDSWSLLALGGGYTIVDARYVLEWYAALGTRCGMPLHELPPPAQFEPTHKLAAYGSAAYLRPEPPTCSFSLFPLPKGAGGVYRSRAALFSQKVFYLPEEIAYLRNHTALEVAGAVVPCDLHDAVRIAKPRHHSSSTVPNFAYHSKYIVVGDALAQHILQCAVSKLKAYSQQRLQRSFAAGAGSPHENDDVNNASSLIGGVFAGLSFDQHSSNGGDHEEIDETENTMRMLVRLHLLTKTCSYLILTERCLHTALLTNHFVAEFVAFPELEVMEIAASSKDGDDNDTYYADHDDDHHHHHHDRDAEYHRHDAEVFQTIIQKKALKMRAAAAGSAEGVEMYLQSPPPRVPKDTTPSGSPKKNNNKGFADNAEEQAGERDADRTPSILSEDEGHLEAVNSDEPGRRTSVASAGGGGGGGEGVGAATSPPRGAPQVMPTAAAIGVPTSVIHCHIEDVRNTTLRVLNPKVMSRLEAAAAAARHHRRSAVDVSQKQFMAKMHEMALTQLRVLRRLHSSSLLSEVFGVETMNDGNNHSGIKSAAQKSLEELCMRALLLSEQVVPSLAAIRQASMASDVDVVSRREQQLPQRSAALTARTGGDAISVNRPRQGVAPMNGADDGCVRPGTSIIRYPAPLAQFLGPNQNNRGRLQLSEEHHLTAKLLTPVKATNLTAVAEKKRLFLKRFGPGEGEHRFALWMKGNGADWTIELYRTLDARNLTLLEMLEYE